MPIDPNFQASRSASTHDGLQVWKSRDSIYGIFGSDVAVDFDLCVGDGACIEVCPANVFDWHGVSPDRKAIPTRERDCIYCLGCEAVCPKFAIWITRPKGEES